MPPKGHITPRMEKGNVPAKPANNVYREHLSRASAHGSAGYAFSIFTRLFYDNAVSVYTSGEIERAWGSFVARV